ncbi:hypothetical protein GH146_02830 [archaeon]|nr:hypothetical protein [archaeon]
MGSWTPRFLFEGDRISFIDPTSESPMKRYYHVRGRDFSHIEWEFGWPEVQPEDRPVAPGQVAGPYSFPQIRPTTWSETLKQGHMFQWIVGIKPDVKWYIQLPSETKRHGTPKLPWPKKNYPEVAHFTMQMSPFDRPTFVTEHFLIPKLCDTFGIDVYNPLPITVTPHFNFYINKLNIELIGDVTYTEDGILLTAAHRYYEELLENLHKGLKFARPITLFGVAGAPAER